MTTPMRRIVHPRNALLNDIADLLDRAVDGHLPLSIRYAAAEAAVNIVEIWAAQFEVGS